MTVDRLLTPHALCSLYWICWFSVGIDSRLTTFCVWTLHLVMVIAFTSGSFGFVSVVIQSYCLLLRSYLVCVCGLGSSSWNVRNMVCSNSLAMDAIWPGRRREQTLRMMEVKSALVTNLSAWLILTYLLYSLNFVSMGKSFLACVISTALCTIICKQKQHTHRNKHSSSVPKGRVWSHKPTEAKWTVSTCDPMPNIFDSNYLSLFI